MNRRSATFIMNMNRLLARLRGQTFRRQSTSAAVGNLLTRAGLYLTGNVRFDVRAKTLYHVACFRSGRLLWTEAFPNRITNVGRAHILGRAVKGQTVPNAFNSGLYNDGRVVPRQWAVGQTVAVGDVCRPTDSAAAGARGRLFVCITGGATHGSTEPTWPTTVGGTVSDNTATWQEATSLFVGLKGTGSDADADTMASHGGWSEITVFTATPSRAAFTPGAISGTTTATCNNSGSVAVFTFTDVATVAGAFLTDFATKGGATGLLYGVGDFSQSRSVISGDILNVTVTTTMS